MSESTSYNLHYNKADHIQVPIQLQLNNDRKFLSQLHTQEVAAEELDSSDESDMGLSRLVSVCCFVLLSN